MRISPDFFTTLGIGPVMGRTFTEEETITPVENHGAAILTDAYWRHAHDRALETGRDDRRSAIAGLQRMRKLGISLAIDVTDRKTILNPIWMPIASHRKDNPAAN